MRAIEIDPTTKTVNEIDLADGGLQSLQKAVGCDTIQSVMLDRAHSHVMWLDDNGLVNRQPGPGPFFQLTGRDDVFCGKGVITGLDEHGDAVESPLPHILVAANVTFPEVEFVGLTETVEHGVEVLPGLSGSRFRIQAVFRKPGDMKAEHKQ